MNDWPKCPRCGALLVVNEYYSVGYCPTPGCVDSCLTHRQPISSDGVSPRECLNCCNERLVKEAAIEKEHAHVA